jgi:hypothetical protein
MEMKMSLNRFLAAMALASTLGSPALAQSYGIGNGVPAAYGAAYSADVYAQAPRAKVKSHQSELNRSDSVIDGEGNVEADPDPNIRSQLERENNSGF